MENEKELEQNEEIEILDSPQNDPEAALTEAQDKYHRVLAEFDNFRKRTTKEMFARHDDGIRTACEKLLPIVDNFERALNAQENKEDPFYQGITMIARQLNATLEELGVEPIPIEKETPFDPNLHNAVAHIQDESHGQNVIIDELQKGYMHKDKVIRHSMVRVAN